MENLIVIKKSVMGTGNTREYWPRFDKPLSKGDVVIKDEHYPKSEKTLQMFTFSEYASVEYTLVRIIHDIPGVYKAYLNIHYVNVSLLPGHRWPEVEPLVLNAIKEALRWKDFEIIDYVDWLKSLDEEGSSGKEVKTRTTDEQGVMIIIDIEDLLSTKITVAPPWTITAHTGNFSRPMTSIEKRRLKKLEADVQDLVQSTLKIEGVLNVHVSGFFLTVSVSPSFDAIQIKKQILKLLKKPN